MHSAENQGPFNGGMAHPGLHGVSLRDLATLEILSALIAARCTLGSIANLHTHPARPEWVIEAMDMADVFLELRSQI